MRLSPPLIFVLLLAAAPALASGPRPSERTNGFVLLAPPHATPGTDIGAPFVIGRYGCAADRGEGVRTGTLTGMALGAITGAVLGGDKGDATDGAFLGGIAGGALGAILAPSDPAFRCRDAVVAAEVAERTDHWTNPLRGYTVQDPKPLAPRELWDDTLPEAERERRRAAKE